MYQNLIHVSGFDHHRTQVKYNQSRYSLQKCSWYMNYLVTLHHSFQILSLHKKGYDVTCSKNLLLRYITSKVWKSGGRGRFFLRPRWALLTTSHGSGIAISWKFVAQQSTRFFHGSRFFLQFRVFFHSSGFFFKVQSFFFKVQGFFSKFEVWKNPVKTLNCEKKPEL